MPTTEPRTDTTPDYWPERKPRYESFHSGVVAWSLVGFVALTAASAAWLAIEVRTLREAFVLKELR